MRDERSMDPASPDGVLVFDGHCNFCSANVAAILRADRDGLIRFTPLQSPYGRFLAARHGVSVEDPSTLLFFERGEPLTKSAAAIALARRLPRPFRWASALRFIPAFLRDGVYTAIARNRYRIAGRRDACFVPTPDQRSRFIEDVPGQAA